MPTLPVSTGDLLQFPDDPVAYMRGLHRRHGDIACLEDEGQRLFFVFSPEYNKQVLADSKTYHSRFFAVRGGRRSAQRRVTSGLLSMNEGEHKQHRRMIAGPFQKMVLPTYHGIITDLTNRMLDDWEPGDTRDVNADMTKFMLRLTSALLFGVDEPDFAVRIGHMIEQWVWMNHETGMGALVADRTFLDRYDELLEMATSLEKDVQEMIALRRSSDRPPGDVLSLLIKAAQHDPAMSEKLTGHITLLFGAAHLTTAHTFSWTLFLLAQHPEIMAELFDELEEGVAGLVPEQHEIQNLSVLDRVLKESMRILPASGYSQRVVNQPTQLGPFHLSRGSSVIFSQFITHHREDLYSEPDRFYPDRWKTISPSPYEYLPFGAGPRMCIGAPLAIMELKTALVMILKRFKLTVEADSKVDGRIISTMLGPTSQVRMQIRPADGQFEAQPVYGSIHDLVDLPPACIPTPQRRVAA
ncbi:MAG: cytochrome P450 [Planctomycetaceae bacterium]